MSPPLLCLLVHVVQLKLDLAEQERDKFKGELKRKVHELESITRHAENESSRSCASSSTLATQVEENQETIKVRAV